MQVMAALFYFLLSSSPAGQKWSIERKFLFLVFFFLFLFFFFFWGFLAVDGDRLRGKVK